MKNRALVSLIMIISFILLPISGIPLHLIGELSLQDSQRHFLMSIHNSASIIFIIALFVHIFLNWKSIKNYIFAKTKEYFVFKKEIIIALIIVIGIVGIFTSHVFHIR